jgi:hypothetical protein
VVKVVGFFNVECVLSTSGCYIYSYTFCVTFCIRFLFVFSEEVATSTFSVNYLVYVNAG